MHRPRNLAARAGRWSATHRKMAILGWLAFVALAFVIGGKVGTNTLSPEQSGVRESEKAERIVTAAFPKSVEEKVLIQSDTLKADEPAFRAAVADVSGRLDAIDGVTAINSPYGRSRDAAISPDGRSALVTFEIPGDLAESPAVAAAVDASVAAVQAAQKAHPELRVSSRAREQRR